MIKKLLSDPLLHFLILAFVFFGIYDMLASDNNAEQSNEDNIITISDGRIEQLKMGFEKIWRHQPTNKELDGLIKNYALDEIYSRQARELELDVDDGIIRKRLRQKMEFMIQDISAITPPSESELTAWYQSHTDIYRDADQFTFQQVYYPAKGTPETYAAHIKTQKDKISQGHAPDKGNTMLATHFTNASRNSIAKQFGDSFAKQLKTLPVNSWSGPVRSSLGLHFVYIKQYKPGKLPPLNMMRDQVLIDWHYQKNIDFKADFEQKLLTQYTLEFNHEQNASK